MLVEALFPTPPPSHQHRKHQKFNILTPSQQIKMIDELCRSLAKVLEEQQTLAHDILELASTQELAMPDLAARLGNVQRATKECLDGLVDLHQESAENAMQSTAAVNDTPSAAGDAGERLTGTFELLEKILLDPNLDMETVFWTQGVNRVFNTTIKNSRYLQQKLFLEPQQASQQGSVINPLLMKASVCGRLPFFLQRAPDRIVGSGDQGNQRLVSRLFMQSSKSCASVRERAAMKGHGTWLSLCLTLGTVIQGRRSPDYDILDAGSWQQMYLTQPAVPIFCAVKVYPFGDWENCYNGFTVVNIAGTVEQLLEALAKSPLGCKV
ncbi:hypothetical protein LTS10_005151 [Elasticomyces elasticus]|nr:hypothetical protein LTS10_005151 [Elasticomyces elasticus]